jgi:hypothetical protein
VNKAERLQVVCDALSFIFFDYWIVMYLAIGFSSSLVCCNFFPQSKDDSKRCHAIDCRRPSRTLLSKNALKFSFFEGEKYKQLSTSMCKKAHLLDEMPGLPAGNESSVPLSILRWAVL